VQSETAGVAPPTGTVNFFDGPAKLGEAGVNEMGIATLETSSIFPGLRSITAVYAGDERFSSITSAALSLTVSGSMTSVSAANYQGATLTPEQIIAAFGSNLATTTSVATTLPLPTTLAGTSVSVRDSAGAQHSASLFFVSPFQVNYLMPAGVAPGPASVSIVAGDGATSTGAIEIGAIAPGIFSADSSGSGLAAAQVLRVKADGSQSFELVARYDPALKKFVPAPIDFGEATDQLFLILYGTGFRNRSALTAVAVTLGNSIPEVVFAGAQGALLGLDQINLRLPRELAGAGDVELGLDIDQVSANKVTLTFK
jgi:uncharacterized protein (TIGR03437 family)